MTLYADQDLVVLHCNDVTYAGDWIVLELRPDHVGTPDSIDRYLLHIAARGVLAHHRTNDIRINLFTVGKNWSVLAPAAALDHLEEMLR